MNTKSCDISKDVESQTPFTGAKHLLSIEVVSTDLNLELFWQIKSISKDLSRQHLSKEIWSG